MIELLLVFLMGASPISEIRGAIPIGIFVFKQDPLLVFFLAVLGNLLVAPVCLFFLRYISSFLMQNFSFFKNTLEKIFNFTRKKHSAKFEKWEHWALLILVAIPLPFTGAWSGSLAAFLFNVPLKKSLLIISFGVIIASVVVLALSLAGVVVADSLV